MGSPGEVFAALMVVAMVGIPLALMAGALHGWASEVRDGRRAATKLWTEWSSLAESQRRAGEPNEPQGAKILRMVRKEEEK